MRRITILACLLMTALTLALPQDISARKRGGKKSETPDTAVVKKSEYEKFISKKGVECAKGFVNVYKDGKDIWFEIPDSLMGRRIIQRSIMEQSSSVQFGIGKDVSNNPVYMLSRTDSVILFQKPAPKTVIMEDGDNIRTAVDISNIAGTVYAFPIKYRNADSTAFVVKVNDLFDFNRKEVVDLVGYSYADLLLIANSEVNDKLSRIISVDSFDNTVGVRKETGFKLTLVLSGFGLKSANEPIFSSRILSSFTLLPEKDFPVLDVDERIGVRNMKYQKFNPDGVIEDKQTVCRWDLEGRKNLIFYVDTLFSPSWADAVKKGLEAWNPAFEKIGYKDLIKVLPYPADDPSFRIDNPFVNVVAAVGGGSRNISANILTDSSTGEIMGVRMMVPGNFVTGVRWNHSFEICDVDPRYQGYMIADDAVCEVLTVKVMSLFGRCLGLERNHAGSHAWSPEHLSDVEFTREHGITASVTDDVVFNVFAKPGDKEKGLATVVDRIGPYDEYAIEWIYGKDYTKQMRDSVIAAHVGDPAFFYATRPKGTVSDPRVTENVLGNDPLAYCEAVARHCRFVAEHSAEWLASDDVPQEYKDLFVDWLHSEYTDAAGSLATYVGGMYANYVEEGSETPKFVPVPEELQRECLSTMISMLKSSEWFTDDRTILHYPGPNRHIDHFNRVYLVSLSRLYSRMLQVAMCMREAAGTYTVEEYLDDMERLLLEELGRGVILPGGEFVGEGYVAALRSMSPVMKQNHKDFKEGGWNGIVAETDFRVPVSGVPVAYVEDFELHAWNYMKRANRILKKGRALCKDEHDRYKYDYMILLTEVALGK